MKVSLLAALEDIRSGKPNNTCKEITTDPDELLDILKEEFGDSVEFIDTGNPTKVVDLMWIFSDDDKKEKELNSYPRLVINGTLTELIAVISKLCEIKGFRKER